MVEQFRCVNYSVFLIFLCFFQSQLLVTGVCKDKYRVFPDHSACLPRSPKAKPGHVNKDVALAVHNRYRLQAAKTYKATNMIKMIWDDEVAMVAQKWAENCKVGHDSGYQRLIPGRFSSGQNIAGFEKQLTWETIVQLFYNESKDFTYGSNKNILAKVGHFTQLTWAESYILGCGYAVCDGFHFYVCNYAPSGNQNGQLGYPFKINGKLTPDLIECKQKKCEGGSLLDSSTCKCSCPLDYYNKTLNFLKSADDNCQLSCVQDLKEEFFCGSKGYAEKSCMELSNVPFDCPKTCHICPYSDPTYKEGDAELITLAKSSGLATAVSVCNIVLLMYISNYITDLLSLTWLF